MTPSHCLADESPTRMTRKLCSIWVTHFLKLKCELTKFQIKLNHPELRINAVAYNRAGDANDGRSRPAAYGRSDTVGARLTAQRNGRAYDRAGAAADRRTDQRSQFPRL